MFGTTYTKRIKENFCKDCKYRRQATETSCPKFVLADGVCVQFEWSSKDRRQQYQDDVLDSQASTIWAARRISLEERHKMKRAELRSVLTEKHYAQFDNDERRSSQLLSEKLEQQQNAALAATMPKQGRKKTTMTPDPEEVKKRLKEKEALKEAKKAGVEVQPQQEKILSAVLQKEASVPTKEVKKDIFPKLKTQVANATPQHYFYCQKPDGKKVTYRRDTTSKTYSAEVPALRKYLQKQKISILNEEIK